MKENKTYRKNAAAVVINGKGEILACRRADQFKAWQVPQGGVKKSESTEEAMLRELEEEIGTREVEVIGALPEPIRYDWPEHLHKQGYCGQEQYYFLVRLDETTTINVQAETPAEFDLTEWVTATEFFSRLLGFKKEAYVKAVRNLQQLFPGMIAE